MSGIIGFVQGIIEVFRELISTMVEGVSFLTQIIQVLPVFFVAPLLAILTVLVVYTIVGRGA